jgi:structural maintenance of chromosome 2
MAKGGKIKSLTEAVNALERELVKVKTQLEIKVGVLGDDSKRVDGAKKSLREVCH